MHSAPSVTYPVGRCRLAAFLMAAAWTAGAAAVAAWMAEAPSAVPPQLAAAASLAAAGVFAAIAWLRSPGGAIALDGAGWRWRAEGGERPGTPSLVLDLQHWLLLHWRPESGAAGWLWLERGRAPHHWDALRRAVYSPAGAKPQSPTS